MFRIAVIAFGVVVGISSAHAQSPAQVMATDLLQRAVRVEIIATTAPNDRRVQAVAAAMATDFRARAQLIMQAERNQLIRDELAQIRVGAGS